MHFSILILLLTATNQASTLGINCRGSWPRCKDSKWHGNGTLMLAMAYFMTNSTNSLSILYQHKEYIACYSNLDSNRGICAFLQGTALTLNKIVPLAYALIDHGCHTCGSAPVHYLDQDSNDPKGGIITFNYVANAYCAGNCIVATAIAPTVQTDDNPGQSVNGNGWGG